MFTRSAELPARFDATIRVNSPSEPMNMKKSDTTRVSSCYCRNQHGPTRAVFFHSDLLEFGSYWPAECGAAVDEEW